MILEQIKSPEDLRGLSPVQLQALAGEIRQRITDVVSNNGGHLASNLGVVELTLALHRVFDFTQDHLVFDVGHQCYTHKLLTGRAERFDTLRQEGGLSGFPNRQESPQYDRFTTGHAGVSISTALGLALADQAAGRNRRTVAVVGDGALGSGVALEGLNHAGSVKANLLVILNDNKMCISGTVGALAHAFTRARTSDLYQDLSKEVRRVAQAMPVIGTQLRQTLSTVKDAIKDAIVPDHAFEHFGFRVLGPVNGHNLRELLRTLEEVRGLSGPIMLHVCTEKGHGFEPAVNNPEDYHSASPFVAQNGKVVPRAAPAGASAGTAWGDAAAEILLELAADDERIMAITAAMPAGTGLEAFEDRYPARFFDAGIAESHAVAMAAGMAAGGMRPVCAIYSTFLQRSYDQLFHELALNVDLPVMLLVDRAGLVGADGMTHQGLYDIAYMRSLPNLVLAAPADKGELRGMLRLGLEIDQSLAIRYPRDVVPEGDLSRAAGANPVRLGKAAVLREGPDGAIIAYGWTVEAALAAAETLAGERINVTVVSGRFAKPLDEELIVALAGKQPWLMTVEDGCRAGGFGSAILELLQGHGLAGRLADIVAVPDELVEHASRGRLLERFDLSAAGLVRRVRGVVGG